MIQKLTMIDDRAKHLKEDRSDYIESRKFMVQKLKKDLDKMKAGLTDINEIERKYAFLHNDKDFQIMMQEIKKEIHPGSSVLTRTITAEQEEGQTLEDSGWGEELDVAQARQHAPGSFWQIRAAKER